MLGCIYERSHQTPKYPHIPSCHLLRKCSVVQQLRNSQFATRSSQTATRRVFPHLGSQSRRTYPRITREKSPVRTDTPRTQNRPKTDRSPRKTCFSRCVNRRHCPPNSQSSNLCHVPRRSIRGITGLT